MQSEMPHTDKPEDMLIASKTRAEKVEEKDEEDENERLVIFTDAVIAFVITIAAVPLKLLKDPSTGHFFNPTPDHPAPVTVFIIELLT